ncbi:hypothetical protein OpiT1DRAFT_00057 [Opitutaceae bacterium TAV1]|nr:hypothetical protein OpiT1DRAFT_00057 [Opitutaceae bacterium TAV1]
MIEKGESSPPPPCLQSVAAGDTVWITRFFVPQDLRGRHLGTTIVRNWEKNLPAHVRTVRLRAPATDPACPGLFWQKLGFRPVQPDNEPAFSEFDLTRFSEMEKHLPARSGTPAGMA